MFLQQITMGGLQYWYYREKDTDKHKLQRVNMYGIKKDFTLRIENALAARRIANTRVPLSTWSY
jgi:hypothetical protein